MLSDADYEPSGQARGPPVSSSSRTGSRSVSRTTTAAVAWRSSPGGLVSALTPVLRHGGGVWVGWAGQSGDVEAPRVVRRHRAARGADQRRRVRRLLRRIREPHAVAAVSRRGPHAELRPALVAGVRDGEPPLRRGGRGGGRTGRDGVGARLPPATRPDDVARAPARRADRLLPAHPVPARRSCSCSCRGAARSSKACSAPTSSASRCPARRRNFARLARRLTGATGADERARSTTAAWCASARSRSRSTPPQIAERATDPR